MLHDDFKVGGKDNLQDSEVGSLDSAYPNQVAQQVWGRMCRDGHKGFVLWLYRQGQQGGKSGAKWCCAIVTNAGAKAAATFNSIARTPHRSLSTQASNSANGGTDMESGKAAVASLLLSIICRCCNQGHRGCRGCVGATSTAYAMPPTPNTLQTSSKPPRRQKKGP